MNYPKLIVRAGLVAGLVGIAPIMLLPGAAQSVAQTPEPRKAEADKFLNQGIQQYETNQLEAAIPSLQQALKLYQELNDRNGERRSLGNLALVHTALGKYAQAIEFEQQSLAIAIEIKHRLGEGQSLAGLANIYRLQGNPTKAIDYGEKSLVIMRELKNRREEGYVLAELGISYFNLKNYAKSIQFHQQSFAINTELKDKRGAANDLRNLGISYQMQQEYSKALDSFQKSLAIRRELKDRPGEAKSLQSLGSLYKAWGQYAKSVEYYEQSLAIAQELKSRKDESRILDNLATVYEALENSTKAIAYSEQSLAIAQALKDPSAEAIALENLGRVYQTAKNPAKAIESLQKSLAIYRELQQKASEAYVLTSLGIIYFELQDYQKSLEFHQQSLAIDMELNDKNRVANTLRNIGLTYKTQQDFSQALSYFEKSLAIRQELKDRAKQIELLESLAALAYEQKDYTKAIEYYQRNLLILREDKNLQGEMLILRNLGIIYGALKQSDENSAKAVQYYTESIQLAQKLGDQKQAGKSLRSLGILHMDYNRFARAVESFQQSLTIWQKLKDEAMEANVLVNLGNLYATRVGSNGETWCTQAIESYEKSLPILRKLKNQALEGSALGGLGYCYEDLKNHPKAIEYHRLSLAIARQTNNKLQQGLALINLGKSYQSMGNLPQARQSTEQGLVIVQEIQNRTHEVGALDNLASIYAALGEHRKAIETQTQRMIIAHKYQIKLVEGGFNAVAVNVEQAKKFNLSNWVKRQYQVYGGRLEKLGFSLKDLNLSESNISGFLFYIKESWMSLGDAYYKVGNYSKALEFYQAALDPEIEQGYNYGLFDIKLLGKVGDTLSHMGRLSEAESILRLALKYGENFRTGMGYATMSSSGKVWSDSDRIALAERQVQNFQQLQRVLVRQNRTDTALEIAEEGRARTFVELLSARIRGNQLPDGKNLPPALNLAEIRQIAKVQNATLVQYSIVSPEELYIWVIKPTGEISFQVSQLKQSVSIQQLVAGSRGIAVVSSETVRAIPASDLDADLKRVYQALIAPIAADLPTDPNQRVVFLPQGELFLVPFPALKNEQGQYLIEKHTISTAPSIQTLQLTREKAKKSKVAGEILIVGDPQMPIVEGAQLTPLPGARQEAITIAKMLNTQPLIGDLATKPAVLQQIESAAVIHLATHGLLTTIEGSVPGAIALAPSGQDSGLLTASEIFDLKLTAGLVVLSACDTGRGIIRGDGVIGLSRSLIAAGVPSVVVSLWAVNDRSTSALMSDFYRNLAVNPNKAQALRQAMLTTMQQYPNPRDWAAFTLVGESDRP